MAHLGSPIAQIVYRGPLFDSTLTLALNSRFGGLSKTKPWNAQTSLWSHHLSCQMGWTKFGLTIKNLGAMVGQCVFVPNNFMPRVADFGPFRASKLPSWLGARSLDFTSVVLGLLLIFKVKILIFLPLCLPCFISSCLLSPRTLLGKIQPFHESCLVTINPSSTLA